MKDYVMYSIDLKRKAFNFYLKVERKLAGLTLKSMALDEGRVQYLEGGNGPTLVLLHGFGANKDNWNKLTMYLQKHFHVIALDIPGFGQSFKMPDVDYSLASQLARVHEFVKKLGLSEFQLCGNSYGGYLAANYAATYCHKVTKLTLLNPLGVGSAVQSEVFNDVVTGRKNLLLPAKFEEFTCLFKKCFSQAPYVPSFVIKCLAQDAVNSIGLNNKLFHQVHLVKQDKIEFEQAIECSLQQYLGPIEVVWGNSDEILHPQGANVLANELPNTKVLNLDNVGHLPMLEQPKKLAKFMVDNKVQPLLV